MALVFLVQARTDTPLWQGYDTNIVIFSTKDDIGLCHRVFRATMPGNLVRRMLRVFKRAARGTHQVRYRELWSNK